MKPFTITLIMLFLGAVHFTGCLKTSRSQRKLETTPIEELCQNTFEPHKPLPTASGHESPAGTNTEEIEEELGLPEHLSETGLYSDIHNKTVHNAVLEFKPQFQLWSDGADKKRWVYLPECETVDTTDMNAWALPVGTRLFKEFSIDGTRIETRLIERVGEGPYDFLFAAYVWNDEETEATMAGDEGAPNIKGTSHDIPSKADCRRCHGSHAKRGGLPARALGFSALQLAHTDSPLSLDMLVSNKRLSDNPTEAPSVPGSPTEKAALGYLHANCGNCHNDSQDGIPQVNLNFWLDVNHASVEDTGAFTTAISQSNQLFNDQHVQGRIVPGNPHQSAVFYRMNQRGNLAQMPPLATKTIDSDGIAAIQAWIEGLE